MTTDRPARRMRRAQSTTPFRVVTALIVALFGAPLIMFLLLFVPDIAAGRVEWGDIAGVFTLFLIVGPAMSIPLIVFIGGPIWYVLHWTRSNSLLNALVSGGIVGTFFIVFINGKTIVGSVFDIEGSYGFGDARGNMIENGQFTALGWHDFAWSLAGFALGGVICAFLVWCIAYAGRPYRDAPSEPAEDTPDWHNGSPL